jgi:hypothetical protein
MILLITCRSSFAEIASHINQKPILNKEKVSKGSLDKLQTAEILKSAEKLENRYKFPVVDHHSIKMSLGLEHIKKCIKEETEGTIDTFDNKLSMTFSVLPSGLVKDIKFENIEELPIYLKACFISGISRVVFPQPLDGEDTIISQQFAIKLNADDPIKDRRLLLDFVGRINILPRFKL